MNVYIWDTELKNAYIGEYTGFEYSYDFRGKTSSQVISDWWSYWASTTWIGCDSNWLYWTSNGSRLIMYTDFDMRNASKITLEAQVKTETDYDLNFWLCSSIQRTNWTFIYQCRYNNDDVAVWWLEVVTPNWNDYNWTYAWKYVIDLDAKTYSITRTMGWLTWYSWSITDTMVSNIRNNPMYLMVLSSAKTWCRMQKVSVLIE